MTSESTTRPTPSGRRRSLLQVGAVWIAALVAPLVGSGTAVLTAVVAVLVLPGSVLLRALGSRSAGDYSLADDPLARPAIVITLSTALCGLSVLACTAAALPMHAALLTLMLVTLVLAALPSRGNARQQAASQVAASRESAGLASNEKLLLLLLAASVLLLAVMAASGANIARDRMWYMAFITRLADGNAMGMGEPFFGSGLVLPRFAGNAWISTLAAWTGLARVPTPLIFEQVAPVLLAPLCASAAYALGRALFGNRSGGIVTAICTVAVLLATRYPFFSPERYAPFGRLAEDKTVALLVFAPTAFAWLLAVLRRGLADARQLLPAALLLAAVALSHAIVYLALMAWTAAALLTGFARGGQARTRTAVGLLVLLLALPPAFSGLAARQGPAGGLSAASMAETDPLDPVVRAHLRMQRTVQLPLGGPVTNPRLLDDPLLLLALAAGLAACLLDRRKAWARLLLAACLGSLLLAFTPFLSPLFGRAVVPWMAYRALWLLLPGPLLAAGLLELPRLIVLPRMNTSGPLLLLTLLVLAFSLPHFPWARLSAVQTRADTQLQPDRDTLELLDELAALPPNSVIATGPGLSELVPAYAGRYVLAFSDRGTVVFSGSRKTGDRRLRAAAALLGLRGGSRGMRNRLAATWKVSHVVTEGQHCDRKGAPLFSNQRYTLCAERYHREADHRLDLTTAVASASGYATPGYATPDNELRVLAGLGRGLSCDPAPELLDGVARWRRDSRWQGSPLSIRCTAEFETPRNLSRLRISARLPRAGEALVYRVLMRGPGQRFRRHGALEFKGNPHGEIRLRAHAVDRVEITLAPAYLPYLNLESIELLGP